MRDIMAKKLSRIARLSQRIFGEVPRELEYREKKIVDLFARRPIERDVLDYYPPSFQQLNMLLRNMRQLGLYRDEHLDFRDEMVAQRKARGKGPPERGQGKRAAKRKK